MLVVIALARRNIVKIDCQYFIDSSILSMYSLLTLYVALNIDM